MDHKHSWRSMLDNHKSPDNKRIHEVPVEKPNFPPVDLELLKALQKEYPDVACDFRATPNEMAAHWGQISVVRFLRDIYISQTQPEEK